MKQRMLLLFVCATTLSFSQTGMKQYTVGHPFNISLPNYMERASGVNENAAFEYKNEEKDVYGSVTVDDKSVMQVAKIQFSSLIAFYEDFIKGFTEGEEQVKLSKPISKQTGAVKYLEADLSYYDQNAKAQIYYLVGIVETSKAYYKVMSYCSLENKATFKADFQKILYSLND